MTFSDVNDFCNVLETLLDRQMAKVTTRVGLVPNYFMARGEAISSSHQMFDSWANVGRKLLEKTLKIGRKTDYREEMSYHQFQAIMQLIRDVSTEQHSPYIKEGISRVLNRPCYKNGNTLLQLLIVQRHLKFVKVLLLNTSDMLDLNIRNRRGFTALDLAFDRLEVEMVYILLLHGATRTTTTTISTCQSQEPESTISCESDLEVGLLSPTDKRNRRSSSLGYREWIVTDMIANLDTGRWLNKKSEQAVLDHAQANLTSPTCRESLLEWATKGSYKKKSLIEMDSLATLGRMPQLFAITLADGCDAITNHEAWATLIRYLALLREASMVPNTDQTIVDDNTANHLIETLPTKEETITEVPSSAEFYHILQELGADTTSTTRFAGRTVFYPTTTGDGEIAVKISKSFEDEKDQQHPLVKEGNMNHKITKLKAALGLRSDYPVTLKVLKLTTEIPPEIRRGIEGQESRGYHPFHINHNNVTALVYRPPNGYGSYVNDPDLPLEVCRKGIQNAMYDSAVLARHGLYHASLVDIQHDASREQRPHLWSFESFLTRFRTGAGRIEKGFAGLHMPNVRASGLADLKHIIDKEQVKARYDPSVIHAQHNILYDDHECMWVSLVEQLGASLFATALLIASSWQSRHIRGTPPQQNIDLAQDLKASFITFLQGYLSIGREQAERLLDEQMGTNFDRMADQIQMFATSKYVEIAETAPRRPCFGTCARLLGFVSHPTAFVHLCQNDSRRLDRPGCSLEEIRQVYCYGDNDGTRTRQRTAETESSSTSQSLLPEGFPRVDTSMMRASPTWQKGKGWVSSPRWRLRQQQTLQDQPHFGSYEGVLPFQQMIRDLYAVVYLSWLLHNFCTVDNENIITDYK